MTASAPAGIITRSAKGDGAMGQFIKAFSELWDQTVERMGWPGAFVLFAAGLLLAWLFLLLTRFVARRAESRMPPTVGGFVVGSLAAACAGAAFLLSAFALANWFDAAFVLWKGAVGGAIFGFVVSLFRQRRLATEKQEVKPHAEAAAAADRGHDDALRG
jgi:hypothetical protein